MIHKNIRNYFILIIGLCILISSCTAQNKKDGKKMDDHKEHKYTNKLINESSPYLLQHAHNPVDWHPWGDEALEKAQKEDKLLLISIGYAACHWCHVMEHESFEDDSVAAVMNKYFVPIKIDREERPDIDQIYMNACHLMNQRGGWPLNAIALPDGRPVFAGTYFPKDRWLKVLQTFIDLKNNDFARLEEQANQITEGVRNSEMVGLNTEPVENTKEDLLTVFEKWAGRIDFKKGGRAGSPKFPMPSNYLYLLKHYKATDDDKALEAITSTLDNMAFGGIYDHLGGGFARYSVDAIWKVPHFEKMTYDNGQLISLYSLAYQETKNPLYKKVVYETIEYVKREMTSPEGGFYSSLDADSEGVEGKFYVWEEAEIDSLLGDKSQTFKDYYTVKRAAQWEHRNILYRTQKTVDVGRKNDLSSDEVEQLVADCKKILMKERDTRIRPGLDDKILTSWNALMIKGLLDAYRVFDEQEFLDLALRNADFLTENAIQKDNRLNRNYKDGKSSINAFLDDYALLIDAFIGLYQATFEEKWLNKADDLMQYTLTHFFDEKSGMFFYTSDVDNPLIARKMEVSDNVIPASNSSIALDLFYLGTYLYKDDYKLKAKQMFKNVKSNVVKNGPFYSNWAILMYYLVNEPYEVAIVGEDWKEIRKELDQNYLPNVLFLGGANEGSLELLKDKKMDGQTTIYVCQNRVCKFPVTEAAKALKLIKE